MTRHAEQQVTRGTEAAAPSVPAQAGPVDSVATTPRPATSPPRTGPGSVLVERYRLQTLVGVDSAAAAELWRAVDIVLQRDVGVTLLRPAALEDVNTEFAVERAAETIARTLRSGSFEHPGVARLLDVLGPGTPGLPDDVLGAAVTEWLPGRSLAEVVSTSMLRPTAAARAVQSLAMAVAEAHRHGIVLGCDHPQRIRVGEDGQVQLCFALPRPQVEPSDDVRGLGAVLYALLTNCWPLRNPDALRAGFTPAEYGPDGTPLPPSAIRPGVPVELDTVVTGTLSPPDGPGRVYTAAAVHRLIDEVVANDDEITLFPPTHDGLPPDPGDVWQNQENGADVPPDPERRRKMLVAGGALAVAVVLVLAYLGMKLIAMVGEPDGPSIVVDDHAVPTVSRPDTGRPVPTEPVPVTDIEVYDHVGDRDNSTRIFYAVDGDDSTGWRTSTYRQQFPALKPGVGVMASFGTAVQLSELTIVSSSPGSRVEIRSAPSADASFTDTVLITEATLDNGPTTISLADSQPVTHLLVWITKLSGTEEAYSTEIKEIVFHRAAG